jgi:hypothetical protein
MLLLNTSTVFSISPIVDSDYTYLQASDVNQTSILSDDVQYWSRHSQDFYGDTDFSGLSQPSPPVFPRSRVFNQSDSPAPQLSPFSALPSHIITAAERYLVQLPSKKANYVAYTIFGGDNRGVYYNWCVLIFV